ncbi:MAG: MarR family transcriptional regulator [Gammaproteobacteria bacterium]|nr:MarR family transcriptional regulator [Gammaproteobacteria bacterium]
MMNPRKPSRRKPSLSSDAIAEIRDTGPMGRYLGSQLRLTHVAALDALEAAFAPYKSSPTRFALMDQVNERPGSTQATLADLLDVDRTTLVPMIADMERKGLLRRSTLSHDKRAVQLWLTPKGQQLFAKLRPLAVAHEKRLCGDMSSSDKAALIAALRTIRRNISGR